MTSTWLDNLCSRLSGMIAGKPAPVRTDKGSFPGASAPAKAAGVYPARLVPVPAAWFVIAMVLAILTSSKAIASVQGDKIVNNATLTTAEKVPVVSSVVVTVVERTKSVIEFLKYSPAAPAAESTRVPTTYFHDGTPAQSGSDSQQYTAMPPPLKVGTQDPIDLSIPVPLVVASVFHAGEAVFIRTTDKDQNLDRDSMESIVVTITDLNTGDTELLKLSETGPDTGIFLGYFQTASDSALHYNGRMSVVNASTINAHYVDIVDGSDTAADAALIDPFGVVFSTLNGLPVDGATVELFDATTGKAANVFGDDGVSSFPAKIISGSTVTDSSGKIYAFPAGNYRFPFIVPGLYQLKVTPPGGYNSPSTMPTAKIQTLPGAPYVIDESGSRGEPFRVDYGPAIQIDFPLDPQLGTLWLKKSANKSVVSPGDFIGYEIVAENAGQTGTVYSAMAVDSLPAGFHYQKGSTEINGSKARDPAISADGRTLTFTLGTVPPKTTVTIRYVVGVGAATRPGLATNSVTVTSTSAISVNSAKATVQVQEAFLQSRSTILGRVNVGACSENPDEQKKGMEGIGIYLEDGTFVLSDRFGMYHFEGVRTGSHVLQLDLDSIPAGYRILSCEQNSRFAGRAYSQFVDLQGGTMWRADFYLEKIAPVPPVAPRADEAAVDIGKPVEETSHSVKTIANTDVTANFTYKGEMTLEMSSSQNDNILDYRIPLQSVKVPLRNLELTVTLPPGVTYTNGSSSFNGITLPDPQVTANGLIYHLEDATELWHRELQLRAVVDRNRPAGELVSRAMLKFDTESARNVVTPEVTNILSITREEQIVPLPLVVLRPHFPSFGAELSDTDRTELDALVEKLSDKIIKRIDVAGHTDNVRIAPRSRGTYPDNRELSHARAKSVGRYLSAALHLPPEALFISGSGDKEPVATNRSEQGRALNRRVEVKITALKRVETVNLKIIKERSAPEKLETSGATVAVIPTGAHDPIGSTAVATQTGIKPLPTLSPVREQEQRTDEIRPVNVSPEPTRNAAEESPVDLKIALSDGIFNYRLRLTAATERRGSLKVTLELPKSLLYMNGTTLLNGKTTADPEVNGSTLVYVFPDMPQGSRFDLRLQAIMDGEDTNEELTSIGNLVLLDPTGAELNHFTSVCSALGSMDDITALDNPPQVKTVETTPLKPAVDEAESFREQLSLTDRNEVAGKEKEWHITDADGIIGPADGSLIATRINSVRVVLSSSLKPLLLLDGKEIPADRIGFSLKDRDSSKTLYTYIGVDFGEAGKHTLQLKGLDSFGLARFDKTVQVARTGDIAEIRLVSADNNVADGRTPVKARVLLLDKDGKPVTANADLAVKEGTLIPLSANGILSRDAAGAMITVSGDGWINFQPVTASGLYRSVLAYNKATVEIETYVQPKLRDWILVGIAEGTAGYRTVAGHMENLKTADLQESYYDKERLAFYTKGTIKGEWLLTMAYDSTGKKTGTAGNGLFQTIDPNTFYTLYGDASSQQYDAASSRKLFLKIERDQFYALFGDFDSGLNVTELARYSRRMNGVKAEYRSKDHEATVFGSETGQSFVRDELRGDGTSGMYRLTRSGLVMNSESITIEARDRLKSEVVVSSRKLNRFSDYSVDYTAGTLIFKEPITTKDEALNPNYIVVEYEVADAGNDALTYGGRVGTRLAGGSVRIGASYIHEGQVSGGSSLYGLDTSLQFGNSTKLRAEIASSDRDAGSDKANGNAYLAELTHLDANVEGKLYYREQQDGFGLGMQKASEAGTRKFGAELAYRINEHLTLTSQAYRHYNLLTGAVRDLVEGIAAYSDKQYAARLGLRYAGDQLEDGSRAETVQLTVGGSWKTYENRLTLRVDHEQSLFAPSRNVDFPTRTVVGADYQATRDIVVFAQEELTYGDAANSNNTRLGLKSTPWPGGSVATSVAQDLKENSERTYAMVGLAQKWQIDPRWTVDGGLDHNRTLRKKEGYQFDTSVPSVVGNEDFTAVSLGANFLENKIAWSSRAELRISDREDKWGLISGLINEQGLNWGWAGKLQLYHTEAGAGSTKTDMDLRLGMAYRPPVTRWIVLERLDLISADDNSSAGSSSGKRIINNINANYRPDKQSQLSLHYGAKYVLDTIDDHDYSGYTDLMGVEGRYDITAKMDVGLRGSLLHAWGINQFNYSFAPSIGFNMMENAWVNLGYNIVGFEDRDFSKGSFTSQGPFVQFRFKFDQNSVKDGLKMLNQ